jgi:transcriptional regulator with XRE-family HTH domain
LNYATQHGANFFMNLSERFKAERERLGFTQPAVAALAEVGKTTVINWEKGSSSPNASQLELLAKFGMDVLFVVTGQHAGGVAPAPTLSSDEKRLLDSYREAPPAVRKAALAALLSGTHASPSGQSVVGDNAIQIGTMSGKARIKNK